MQAPTTMKIIGYLAYLYSKFVFKTTKWDFHGLEKFYNTWEKEQSVVLIGWHGRILMAPCLKRKNFEIKALVSLHRDGLVMASYLKNHNIGIVGGSSSNNAKGAAINLMHTIQENTAIFIVPDGPNGPGMKMTQSPIYYTYKFQKPLFCVVYSVNKYKIFRKAWDQMMLPLPFSKGNITFLGPFYIPEDASEEELESYRLEIETKMNNTLLSIDKTLGVEKIEIGKSNSRKNKRVKKEV